MKKVSLLFLIAAWGNALAQTCTLIISPDITVCSGNSATLNASMNGTPPYTYSWTPSTWLSCTNCSNPVLTAVWNTTYTVYAADSNNCSAVDSIRVSILPTPLVAAIGGNVTICAGDSTHIASSASNGTSPYNYYWSPPAGLNNPNISATFASPITTTNYTVTVTDANGCSSNTTITIYVVPQPCSPGVYNISLNELINIYPNPTSGKFQIQLVTGNWQLAGSQKQEASIEIYNVLGEKMYFDKILNHIGNSNGVNYKPLILNLDVPNGIYFLNVKTENRHTIKKIIISK